MRWKYPVLLLTLAYLQYELWFGQNNVFDIWRLQQRIQSQTSENEQLETRNQALTAEISDFKQGTDALEAHARSELGMIKKNETFYVWVE